MSDIETAIFSILSADAGVIAAVGDHIGNLWITQGESLPAVAFSRVHTDANQPLNMKAGLFETLIRFDSWATTDTEAAATINAIRNVLEAYRGSVGGVRIGGVLFEDRMSFRDPETQYFKETLDLKFLHN